MQKERKTARFRWNTEKCEVEEVPEVDLFIDEILKVCEKHGFTISHEGYNQSFVIEQLFDPDDNRFARAWYTPRKTVNEEMFWQCHCKQFVISREAYMQARYNYSCPVCGQSLETFSKVKWKDL